MLLNAIKKTGRDLYTLAFDDGSEYKTTLGVISDMRLYAGKELDLEAIDELKHSSAFAFARIKALEYLSRRMMSRRELIKKLVDKGECPEIAGRCANWLSDNGFLDDARYAAAIARHYASKGYGAGRVKAELSRRGIERELWEDALTLLPESGGADRYIATHLKDPADRNEIRKISAALSRRGFSYAEIRSSLDKFMAEEV